MQKYQNAIQDVNGNAVAGATVAVYLYGTTTPATIYSDNGVTPIVGNSVTTSSVGEFFFYAANGRYSLTVTAVHFTSDAYNDITLFDPTDDGAAAINFLQAGTGAVVRTVQAKERDTVSVKDFGAVGNGVADDTAAFSAAAQSVSGGAVSVPSGTYYLGSSPSNSGGTTWVLNGAVLFSGAGTIANQRSVSFGDYDGTWVDSVSSGIYSYLPSNTSINAFAKNGGIGVFSAARSSGGAGATGSAYIGAASFGYNDYIGGASGVWGMYSTVLRKSGNTGFTQGIEIDVANAGSTVSVFPASMFPSGLTVAAWICSGGESTATPGLVGTASCAIGIISNDPLGVANFGKGIVFHNKSISGCDGATGSAPAIVFASGHQQIWFNNSNQAVAEIVSTAKTTTNAIRLDFGDFGLVASDRASGGTLLQISTVASAANYLTVTAATSGNSPKIESNGAGTNLDIGLNPKGSGKVNFLNSTVGGTAGALVGYLSVKINSTDYKLPYYAV